MGPGEILAGARDGLAVMAERYARLVEGVGDVSAPIPGSEWSVREAAVHTAGGGHRFAALARGDTSAVPENGEKASLDARMRSLIADNPETDPEKLADQIRDGYGVFLAAAATVPGDEPVSYHGGTRPNLATITSILLGEPILHGYDVATAVGAPWPIDPGHAAVVLNGYRAFYPAPPLFQPSAAMGLETTFRVEITGVDPFAVRIAGGVFEELPAAGRVDCALRADPVTALLVISGRLRPWPAIALGGLSLAGDRPELGPRFFDLFVFP